MIETIYFEVDHKKTGFGPKTAFLDPKRATLGNRGHETASQAAKRPPTGKLKVSRVTSGYRGLMIPLSRDRPSPKTLLFGLKSIFCGQPKKDCYNHDGTPQRQPFLLTALQGGLRVGVSIYLLYIYLKQPSLRGTYSLLQWKICIKTGQNVPHKSNRNATTNFFFKY